MYPNDNHSGNSLVRTDFAGSMTQSQPETAAMAVAAQAKAAIEARYIMAMHRPRSMSDVRQKLLKDCQRPTFAEVAKYSVKRGRKQDDNGKWVDNYVEGPSIRMAECVARMMGNIDTSSMLLYDDAQKCIVRVTATDLEANTSYSLDVTVRKVVERSKLNGDQVAISSRTNSSGKLVYLVAATDDEIANKQAALVSKAMRTNLLRLVDGDLLDEAMELCARTASAAIQKDPDGERKRLEDGYAKLGVMPRDLAEYLGHDVAKCSPAQIEALRKLWVAIRDGNTTWKEIIDQVREERSTPPDDDRPAAAPAKGTAAVKGRMRQRQSTTATTEPPSQDDELGHLAADDGPLPGTSLPMFDDEPKQ